MSLSLYQDVYINCDTIEEEKTVKVNKETQQKSAAEDQQHIEDPASDLDDLMEMSFDDDSDTDEENQEATREKKEDLKLPSQTASNKAKSGKKLEQKRPHQTFNKWYYTWNSIKCKLCEGTFKSEMTLVGHLKTSHGVSQPALSTDNCASMFSCAICSEKLVGLRATVKGHLKEGHDKYLTHYFAEYVQGKEKDGGSEDGSPMNEDDLDSKSEDEHPTNFDSEDEDLSNSEDEDDPQYFPDFCDPCDQSFPSAKLLKEHNQLMHPNIMLDNMRSDKPDTNSRAKTKDMTEDDLQDDIEDNNQDNIDDNAEDNIEDNVKDNVENNLKDNTKDNVEDNNCRKDSTAIVPLNSVPKCPECDEVLDSVDALEEHAKEKHPNLEPKDCSDCDKKFHTELALKVGKRTHMKRALYYTTF